MAKRHKLRPRHKPRPREVTQQSLERIEVHSVKSLKNLSLDFERDQSMLTGIFGPNGCGKSTILHLLACSYEPVTESIENNRFSRFFLPTSAHLWSGSRFSLHYSHAEIFSRQQPEIVKHSKLYEKRTDRWAPRYENRPRRDCHWIGIETCVPRIESEKATTRVHFTGTADQAKKEVLHAARKILGRDYTEYNLLSAKRGKATYIGVRNSAGSYTELSMGAGEQRVFKILETIHAARKYSLILIDEVDLLLHEGALVKLLEHMRAYCASKSIQVVFTAHRHSLLKLGGINFRHIMQTPKHTMCVSKNTPDAITQLVTEPTRPLRIYVEDDLAEAIVCKVLEGNGARRLATVVKYGSILNAFTLAGAFVLNGELGENDLFVLDGDELTTPEEREKRMKQVVAGDDPRLGAAREKALSAIEQFALPPDTKPEMHIWNVLRAQDVQAHTGSSREVIEAAQKVVVVSDSHAYVGDLLARTGYERTIGLVRVIDTLAGTPEWGDYVKDVDLWLQVRLKDIQEETSARVAPAVPEIRPGS